MTSVDVPTPVATASPPVLPAHCGNGTLDADELCDGAELGGATCATLGFPAGVVRCNARCTGYLVDRCEGLPTWARAEADTCDACAASELCVAGQCVAECMADRTDVVADLSHRVLTIGGWTSAAPIPAGLVLSVEPVLPGYPLRPIGGGATQLPVTREDVALTLTRGTYELRWTVPGMWPGELLSVVTLTEDVRVALAYPGFGAARIELRGLPADLTTVSVVREDTAQIFGGADARGPSVALPAGRYRVIAAQPVPTTGVTGVLAIPGTVNDEPRRLFGDLSAVFTVVPGEETAVTLAPIEVKLVVDGDEPIGLQIRREDGTVEATLRSNDTVVLVPGRRTFASTDAPERTLSGELLRSSIVDVSPIDPRTVLLSGHIAGDLAPWRGRVEAFDRRIVTAVPIDENGNFALRLLPGTTQLGLRGPGGAVPLTEVLTLADGERRHFELEVPEQHVVRLEGQITGAGALLPGGIVSYLTFTCVEGCVGGAYAPYVDGLYGVDLVPATYDVALINSGIVNAIHTGLRVDGSMFRDLDARLLEVRGRVTDRGGALRPEAAGSAIFVQLWNTWTMATVPVAADGTFVVQTPPGRFRFSFALPAQHAETTSYSQRPGVGVVVTVDRDQTLTIESSLRRFAGVLTEDGAPWPGKSGVVAIENEGSAILASATTGAFDGLLVCTPPTATFRDDTSIAALDLR